MNYPGEQWIPSNGTEGEMFLYKWCLNCARDKAMRGDKRYDECDDDELCPIIAASFLGEAVEWRELPDGEIKCMKYVPIGDPIAEPDTQTIDLF